MGVRTRRWRGAGAYKIPLTHSNRGGVAITARTRRALTHPPPANRGGGRDLCPVARRMGVLSCSAAGAAGRSRAGGAPDAFGCHESQISDRFAWVTVQQPDAADKAEDRPRYLATNPVQPPDAADRPRTDRATRHEPCPASRRCRQGRGAAALPRHQPSPRPTEKQHKPAFGSPDVSPWRVDRSSWEGHAVQRFAQGPHTRGSRGRRAGSSRAAARLWVCRRSGKCSGWPGRTDRDHPPLWGPRVGRCTDESVRNLTLRRRSRAAGPPRAPD